MDYANQLQMQREEKHETNPGITVTRGFWIQNNTIFYSWSILLSKEMSSSGRRPSMIFRQIKVSVLFLLNQRYSNEGTEQDESANTKKMYHIIPLSKR